jgi:dipeptidyl aminopeptidase/acylaminoacyl peptidase
VISRRQTLGILGSASFFPSEAGAQTAATVLAEAVFDAPDGVTLRGALYLPEATPPRAAIVVVHGAGERPARYEDWAQIYSSSGFATLIYDKRGCGESGGEYVGAQNTSAPNLRLLTDDAAAAARWLRAHAATAGLKLGFAGASQAGWIVPPAALETGADFIALLSGPACKTSESQEFEAQGREDPLRYAQWLREESETDPLPVLGQLAVPGFWIYGALDRNVPVDLCVRNLDALIAEGQPYEYHIDPEAGHFHLEPAHRRVIAWLGERVGV